MSITQFMERHYRHFNAREMLDAAKSYKSFVENGGKMMVTLAGAMSTAELGVSLAEMIRQGKVHAISCTAANLEEDVFNLVAHDEYKLATNYRDLSPEAERDLRDEGFNRVTDTCIPETVVRHLERLLTELWIEAGEKGEQHSPVDYFRMLFDANALEPYYQVPVEDSWLKAAFDAKIPVYVPGYEDSTMGNIFAARVIDGTVKSHNVLKPGTAQMQELVEWYLANQGDHPIGFYQIGGGIAGDFAICAVPLIIQDLEKEVSYWSYFCQISDSTTSFGSYSGAVPNEKITWNKLDVHTDKFMINSDASIVAPLMFAYVLGE